MKTLEDFKVEFRFACVHVWDDAIEAWFECAGQMNKRGIAIPAEWAYEPGQDLEGINNRGTDPESQWHTDFAGLSDELLIRIGNFLFRYLKYLEYHTKKMHEDKTF